ncbi:polysaccharide lyase family 8 super-sandwich domain-containing protein [Sneathia sanguinegens]|uniref:Polysaccharide lyase family 8 super-sandwich domain-containing protein n=1 Tax=Sneathia sanguinegens TaxID=40543 RepID=A0ABT7HHS8_9FUSO|nr:polysaccharide lyase family 8 super-sandwich domain-containing protein [Sneathia sanguinegens]MDK9580070.1 polysaccharide lyase family 8 super-sandwich domain-containing protein [Sneathia sanguinegens]
MSSNKIKYYEAMNGENERGWYTGDGMLYLYNGDIRQFNDEFWSTVDPYRLPGITVDKAKREDASGSVEAKKF